MASSQMFWDWLTWTFSPSSSAILVTLLISLLSPILIHYLLYRKAPSREPAKFVLVGPSGAGKTSLQTLAKLAHGSDAGITHTSQTPQSAWCTLPSDLSTSEDRYRSENDTSTRIQPQFLLLDTPGHGKLRHHVQGLLTSSSGVNGIVFVVDSAAVASAAGLSEAAEYLYDILLILQKKHAQVKTSKAPTAVPVLVAANKQDVFTSLPADVVGQRLEEEIGRLRQTKSKALLDSGVEKEETMDVDEEAAWLGEYGASEFAFSQMQEHSIDVSVIGGSTKQAVHDWWAWLSDHL